MEKYTKRTTKEKRSERHKKKERESGGDKTRMK